MGIKLYVYRFAPIRIVDGDTVAVMLDMGLHHYQQEAIRLIDEGTCEVRGMHGHFQGWWAATFASLWFQQDEQNFPEYILDFDDGLDALKDAEKSPYSGGPFYFESVKYDNLGKYGRALGIVYRADDTIHLGAALDAANFKTQ